MTLHAGFVGPGVSARAAIADTPGTAWAVARHGAERIIVPGGMAAAIAELPVAALRLPAETVDALRRLGVERIGQVAAMPRAPLTVASAPTYDAALTRLLGMPPSHSKRSCRPRSSADGSSFAEPIGAREDLSRVVARLCVDLCGDLAAKSLGARRLDLVFGRVDRASQARSGEDSRPNRDPPHLARLLGDRLDVIDPGFGIEDALAGRVASRASCAKADEREGAR